MSIIVVDNFLGEEYLNQLKFGIMDDNTWAIVPFTSQSCMKGRPDTYWNAMACKVIFHRSGANIPDIWELCGPLLEEMQAEWVLRLKANCTFAAPDVWDQGWHRDLEPPLPDSNIRVGILYLSDTDGPTRIEKPDGEIVDIECKDNRFVSFPAEYKHSSTTHTNSKSRLTVNINYLPGGDL